MKEEEPRPASPIFPGSFGQRIRGHRLRLGLSQEALAEAVGASTRSLRRWEQDLVFPQRVWRERLALQFGIDPQHLLEAFSDESPEQRSTPSSMLWSVPYARNSCFTGREAILQTMHRVLVASQARAVALSGLGGIGKTQVAMEYAYRYRQEYQAVFWLAAESAESVMSSLQQMADLVQLPEREVAEQSRLINAVRRWLSDHQGWLVIADNVEELDVLQPLLPVLTQGALLLTTRRQALGTLARTLELPPMSEEEGIALLLARSGQSPLYAANVPDMSLVPQNAEIAAQAAELVRFLEGLPLALDQAGSYIQETGCQMADYLQRYREQRKEVLTRRGLHSGNHPASVTTTVMLSVEQVAREHPASSELLNLCAFLHPDAIPENLLRPGSSYLGPVLGSAIANPYQFDMLLAAVRGASLLSRHAERKTLSMHRLVQAVLRDQMTPAEIRLWGEQITRMLNAAFPAVTFETWSQCELYVPHVLACLPLLQQTGTTLREASEVLFKSGSYLLARGRLIEAEPLLTLAVALTEQEASADASVLLERLEKQALLYLAQGKYALTEDLLRRVVALEEQELGPTHPRTARTLSSLGELYWAQGKYEQAEAAHLQAVQIQEQASASSLPLLADMLNNLGVLYYSRGKYAQAETLYRRGLAIREEQLGPDHPETALSLNALGLLYWAQGRYEEAEPVLVRALAIREEQLGPDHPDIGASLNNLAALYSAQKKYAQAEPLYLRALSVHEEQLGANHPDTAASLNNLANLYQSQGKNEQAQTLHQRALTIREEQLGPDHPDTALSLNNLAITYRNQENYEQAEPLFVRALQIREQQLGPDHADTATSLHGLALLRQAQGDYTQARALLERALQIRIQVRGNEHPQTQSARASLAALPDA